MGRLTRCWVLLLLALLVLSFQLQGCATSNKKLDAWVGVHYSKLIESRGEPARKLPDGKGGFVLIYEEKVAVSIPGSVQTAQSRHEAYKPERQHTYARQTLFYVDGKGIIYKWETRG
jgi:hypothetical protein